MSSEHNTDIYYENNYGWALLNTLYKMYNERFKKKRIGMIGIAVLTIFIYSMLPGILHLLDIHFPSIHAIQTYCILTSITWITAEIECIGKLKVCIQEVEGYMDAHDTNIEPSLAEVWRKVYRDLYSVNVMRPYIIIVISAFILNIIGCHINWVYMLLYVIADIMLYIGILNHYLLPNKVTLLKDSMYEVLTNSQGNYDKITDCNMIVAKNLKGYIGKDGKLLYKLPLDLKYFKEKTIGKIVIMGRTTYESMNSTPLPERINIIVTTSKHKLPHVDNNSVFQVHDPVEALALAYALTSKDGIKTKDHIWIIGGASIYDALMKYADKIYATIISDTKVGDKKIFISKDDFYLEKELPKLADNSYITQRKVFKRKNNE